MNKRQDDFTEIDEFYTWIRDYWARLSAGPEGTITNVLNFGYWPAGCHTLFDAQQAFFDKITGLLGPLPEGAAGVEVGCGIGGYATRLLQSSAVSLTCFDLLENHLALTRDFAAAAGVADRLVTVQGNSMEMKDFSENALDFVYCIESSFHYDEKQLFFNEVNRVMKPGAVFVFADISCEDNAEIAFRSGNHFSSRGELEEHITAANFTLVEHDDIGKQVYEPLHKFIKAWNAEHFPGGQAGMKKSKVARYWELVLNNYAQLARDGLMGYQVYKLLK